MTVYVNVGRRVPKRWFIRQAQKVKGFISFQENIWMMIKQSLSLAKKKANKAATLTWISTKDLESEDINYNIEWIKIIIQGTEEQENEEYDEAMGLYEPLGKKLKEQLTFDKRMKKRIISKKVLSGAKIDEAYEKGYGVMSDNNISNKLLELGIITHIEWIKDFDSRDPITK
jgi:hypothetical protein